ncbi:MAG: dephospho-CoA kinase [Erysipelothrix sp.]|nr:dephospho-CoA kinase [Erysipelothrix sp.]
MSNMPVYTIGITGTIGSGKSSVVERLSQAFPTISSDAIVHQLYKDPKIANHIMTTLFNEDVDVVDLDLLRERMFNDQTLKTKLEAIIHPLVVLEIEKFKARHKGIVIVEIPLLFEAKLEYLVDEIVLVIADEDQIIKRLVKNRNMSEGDIRKRMNQQFSVDYKKAHAHLMFENNESPSDLDKKVLQLISIWKERHV